jgi:hypothetical protein
MDVIILAILVLLIFMGVSGMKMGRSMTSLFDSLKQNDPELWRDLAQPSMGVFDLAGYIRANTILFKGNEALATHEQLSTTYSLARKWWFLFQGSGLAIFLLFSAAVVINAQ